ncbi:hypothetical protein [Halostella litorea]|uniref:hypothetical protein n=1 Tax=Halostella litorea TaxID=2528831 RepID=UPI0010929B5C|nr:hypothetical protein [Halostella litorea]
MTSGSSDSNDTVFRLIGGGSAAMNLVVFTVVGQLALGSLPYGVAVGLLAGAGSGLFIPWLLRFSAAQNESADSPTDADDGARATESRLGVVGLGLELGGIAMLAVGFAGDEPDLVTGLGVAVAVAVVVPLVASELVLD